MKRRNDDRENSQRPRKNSNKSTSRGRTAGRAGNTSGASSSAGKSRPRRKASPTKLRIIGGDMRGRPIHYNGEDYTRPMKDSVRENLFNILGRAVRGTICYDLFAGTAALAFESLSRGATTAVTIDQSRHAVASIRKTAESLGVESRIKILTGDAFRISSQLLVAPRDDVPWIVFVSPPYALWESSLAELNTIINRTLEHAPPGSVLVAEMEKKFDPEQLPAGDWDLREYGGTRLAFIEPAMRCGLELPIEGCEDIVGDV